jgi:cell division protein FtsL
LNRLNLMLVFALVLSALGLVHISFEARRLFSERDKAGVEQQRLDAEFRRLDAERQTAASSHLSDITARKRLGMHHPKVREIEWVADPYGAADRALAAAGAMPAAMGPAAPLLQRPALAASAVRQ